MDVEGPLGCDVDDAARQDLSVGHHDLQLGSEPPQLVLGRGLPHPRRLEHGHPAALGYRLERRGSGPLAPSLLPVRLGHERDHFMARVQEGFETGDREGPAAEKDDSHSSTPHPIPPHVGGGKRCRADGSAPFIDPPPA